MATKRRFVVLSMGLLGVTACKSPPPPGAGTATPSASVAPPAPPVETAAPEPDPARVPTAWPIPQGPRLGIFAGEGVGAIRFGANVGTIERLMEAPCEIQTADACRYIGRGVEFLLKDGVAAEIHAHRLGRPTTPKPRTYGIFNGQTPQEVAFQMLQPAARSLLGPPLKTEKIADGGDAHTVEVDTYDGLRVEYDQLPNGKIVVGGMVVVKSDKAAPKSGTPKKKK